MTGGMTGGMFYGGVGVCKCHGEPYYVQPGGKAAGRTVCVVNRRDYLARYAKTEKGREALRAASARFARTKKGRESQARRNARQVRVGIYYVGKVPRPEAAAIINAHARDEMKARDRARKENTEIRGVGGPTR